MKIASVGAVLALVLAACGGAASGGAISAGTVPAVTPSPSGGGSASASSYGCPSAQTSSGPLDCTKLPLGDRKFDTTGPRSGYVYACHALEGSPVVASAPWLDDANGTWDMPAKLAVQGAVAWSGSTTQSVAGSTRTISGDGVPVSPVTTGIFPISPSDPASAYDRNPNAIGRVGVDLALPLNPVPAAAPSCVNMGMIGVTVTGVAIYNAFDAAGYDAVAREEQDACHGHPDQSEQYHYHGDLQACVPDAGSATRNSSLLGYALDGFGIYGPWYDGKVLTSADLDACHGTVSPVEWNGATVSIYHYVSTYDFPYTVACYEGTPVASAP